MVVKGEADGDAGGGVAPPPGVDAFVGVAEGAEAGSGVEAGVGVGVAVGANLASGVAVGVGVGVVVEVGVGVGVAVGAEVGSGVCVGVDPGLTDLPQPKVRKLMRRIENAHRQLLVFRFIAKSRSKRAYFIKAIEKSQAFSFQSFWQPTGPGRLWISQSARFVARFEYPKSPRSIPDISHKPTIVFLPSRTL